MVIYQRTLEDREILVNLPSTRYLGSKRKITNWIWQNIAALEFDSFLDAMSGTGVVGFYAKKQGKQVFSNDILKFNYLIALAIIENSTLKLTDEEVQLITSRRPEITYPSFIQDTFKDTYYTDEENAWLDMVITNIETLIKNEYKRAIAFAALGQACLVKRPFNLFHRKNLYLRFQEVKRGFGNKITWDTPFPVHFKKFVKEYNALVFSNGRENKASNKDVFELDMEDRVDLVYIDPPYLPVQGDKPDYHLYYHFLEGMVDYQNWAQKVNYSRKIKPIKYEPSPWTDQNRIYEAFNQVFDKFKGTKFIVLSYNSKGIPSQDELYEMLRKYKRNVKLKVKEYQYALSKNKPQELLFIAY